MAQVLIILLVFDGMFYDFSMNTFLDEIHCDFIGAPLVQVRFFLRKCLRKYGITEPLLLRKFIQNDLNIFRWKLFPLKLLTKFACGVCPSSKITESCSPDSVELFCFKQLPIELYSTDRSPADLKAGECVCTDS